MKPKRTTAIQDQGEVATRHPKLRAGNTEDRTFAIRLRIALIQPMIELGHR
jgi:hypothetical protein